MAARRARRFKILLSIIPIILNPAARGARAGRLESRLATLASGGTHLHLTRGSGDARRIAHELAVAGHPLVVAAGGDGTLNEVANGLADAASSFAGQAVPPPSSAVIFDPSSFPSGVRLLPTTLGVLPLGTVNVFASELGLPARDLAACWALVEAGRTREVDLPMANGRRFLQLAGVGFDAQAVEGVEAEDKRALGPLAYLLAASQVLAAERRLAGVRVRSACGRAVEGRFALVGNGRFYGGTLRMFPDARPDDGRLDVAVFKRLSHFDLLRYFRGVLMGEHHTFTDVEIFQASAVTVEAAEEERRLPFELDGEPAGVAPVEFHVPAGRLRVIVP